MFLSASLFVEMLTASNTLAFIQHSFSAMTDTILIFYFMIGLYFLFTALVGFHPFVSLTLLIELLNPILAEVSSLSLSVVLITCSLSTVMFSPYNVSLSILAEQIKVNPYKVGLYNISFAIYFMTVSIIIAYFLTFIF